jgi:hypothetical protein
MAQFGNGMTQNYNGSILSNLKIPTTLVMWLFAVSKSKRQQENILHVGRAMSS